MLRTAFVIYHYTSSLISHFCGLNNWFISIRFRRIIKVKDENSVYNNYVSQYCGVVLRRIRKNNNLTGADLAKILNISQQQVSRYERGVTKFTVDMLLSMSIALNVSFESIIKSIIAEIKISKIDDAITLKAKTSIFDTAHFY